MKLLFSEYKSDYSNYIFPYAIWAMPEKEERPALFFERGFLPSSYNLNRYYMCRHIRVKLAHYEPSSENRRILRKGMGISFRLVTRDEFECSEQRIAFCKRYAEQKFGSEIMTVEKLAHLFSSAVCSHVLLFTDELTSQDLGLVVLHLDGEDAAFYYYAFYDLDYPNKSLGMYMMTTAVAVMRDKKIKHIYLGSCYSKNALYKTQFKGCEFWNGFRWADDLNELKYLIKRDGDIVQKHLLETKDFLDQFYQGGVDK